MVHNKKNKKNELSLERQPILNSYLLLGYCVKRVNNSLFALN